MSKRSADGISDAVFIRRVFIVAAVVALGAAVWLLGEVFLLIFGAVLVALILRSISDPVAQTTGIGERWALALVGVALIAVLAVAVMMFGTTVSQQMRGLSEQVSSATSNLLQQLELGSVGDLLKGNSATSLGAIVSRVFAWSTTLLGAAGGVLLVIFGGIYLAADPKTYRNGLIMLVPPSLQPNIDAALDDAHEALRRWLGAQLIAMLLVGVLMAIGLSFLGLPSALALGVIAGLAEFVPVVGPVLASIPILLVAGSQDWQTLLWALGIIIVVQQVESNLITPLVVGRTVAVAPGVALFAIVSVGVLFGPLGLLFGFPLSIVVDVAVRRLYVADTLGEDVQILDKVADGSQ